MVFHWSLSDKSPQVSRTLLSILVVLNNALVWILSALPFISKSSCPFTKHLVTVPRAPITIGITATFMFHSFFNFLARSRYSSFFSLSFNFTLWSAGTAKSTSRQVLFFCCWLSGRQAEIWWSICMSKSQRSLCVSFFWVICSHDQTSILCTVSRGSPFPPSRIYSFTYSVLVCCICLICDWWCRLHLHITYICCFVASFLFLLWYDWSLWHCFMLLFEEIQFLS